MFLQASQIIARLSLVRGDFGRSVLLCKVAGRLIVRVDVASCHTAGID